MADTRVKTGKSEMTWFRQLWAIRDTIIIVATPLLLLPIVIAYPSSKEAKCAYTILIMCIYWMTEALPMAVTALIPIVLFPWLGVLGSKDVCTNYLKDANMLFFGGLLVAVAVEKCNLHKRVALRVLLLVGSKPLWIIFGFMAVTAFLSMWLNNTATTAMMMPIAHAILKELDPNSEPKQQPDKKQDVELVDITVDAGEKENILLREKSSDAVAVNGSQSDDKDKIENAVETQPLQGKEDGLPGKQEDPAAFMNIRKALKLGVPFASSIGGIGTLIGCGPNIVFKGQLEAMYKNAETGINFTSWLVIGFPAMVVDLIGAWLLLMVIFLGPKAAFRRSKKGDGNENAANQIIRTEYAKLGTITFAEIVVLVNFIVLALLWFAREPEFFPGWGDQMAEKGYVTDACVAITISVLLFIFPSKWPNYLCLRRPSAKRAPAPSAPILDWPTVNKQMPWSVIILLGGGFALADACKKSGLSDAIGESLASFRGLPAPAIVAIMCILATLVTSFTSNMATTTIFLPILAELSAKTCVNPIYLMLPATMACSWAFILPVSTPPNAIAHSYGDIEIPDMIKSGLCMCVLCNAVLLFSINTWGYAFFNLGTFPEWASEGTNCTVGAVNGFVNSTLLSTSDSVLASTVSLF